MPAPELDPVADAWQMPRTETGRRIIRIQHGILRAIRDHLDREGFTEVVPPIVGPATDPGIRGAEQATIDYYGHEYKIMSSAILYKQMLASGLDRIYMVSPNVRLEPEATAGTGRHLTEFFQIDLEMREASYTDAIEVGERLVSDVVSRVWETCRGELEGIDAPRWTFSAPFPRLTHAEAIQRLRSEGHEIEDGEEIPWEAEKALSELYPEPFFVTDYPRSARGFYDREDPDRPGILRDFDLIYPAGYGEAVSGGEREHTVDAVSERMRETGEDPADYGWYMEMLEDGVPLTAGFGIGLERLTRFICGLDSVVDARPFPKVPGVKSP